MYRLESLKIANFRSFFDEQQLNFKKTNTTAIYGSNASGKSNTARALDLIKWLVLNSANANIEKLPFEPFALRAENTRSSLIEIEFLSNHRAFRYLVVFDAAHIVHERLIELTSQKEKIVFNREAQQITNIATASKFGFTETLLRKTRETTLLITKAREDNNEYANSVFEFFLHFNVLTCGTSTLRQTAINLLNHNPTMKDRVVTFLRNADFWVRDIKITEIDTPDKVMSSLPFTDSFKQQFLRKASLITTQHSIRDQENKIIGSTEFSLDTQESAGTRAIFDLAAIIINSIERQASLYIDEFGVYLHPDICSYILWRYKDEPSAQLILNTHNESLMNDLEREDIVFVSKNQAEESLITPLTSLAPRKTDPFEKHYRKGLYGGRPLMRARSK